MYSLMVTKIGSRKNSVNVKYNCKQNYLTTDSTIISSKWNRI